MTQANAASFDTILPRLVAAYEQGRLVPFTGAGLSAPACHLWPAMIRNLERSAGLENPAGNENLTVRALRAVNRLQARGSEYLANEVRNAIANDTHAIPPQTAALARLWWPVVLTTNYDDCYVTAFRNQYSRDVEVCGRTQDDVHYVLGAMHEPTRPILWALQGYLGGPFGQPDPRLTSEIVVGHDEYRRVAYAEPQFRRAFAEVFRSRSMLFLGSGLREPYFLDMFSEILETYGPCARPHYALVKKNELDIQFLATRFQTIVVEYDSHTDLIDRLNRLADAVAGQAFRRDRFSLALRTERHDDSAAAVHRLTVIRGPLPVPSAPAECLAVSAGGAGPSFAISDSIQAFLSTITSNLSRTQRLGAASIAKFREIDVYAVRARDDGDLRSLRVIRGATEDLLDAALEDGYRRVFMQVLAAGGGSSDIRPFDALWSFIESVRAFGTWARRHPLNPLELAIHVLDPSIYMEIARGRLDLEELLTSLDLRFWAKAVYPDGRIERQYCQELEDAPLGEFAQWIGLDPGLWQVESIPPIGSAPESGVVPVSRMRNEPLSARVLPGGTLRFTPLPQAAPALR
ncbi:MAG: SIR2 family protein [Bryobacteraceae bacterium]